MPPLLIKFVSFLKKNSCLNKLDSTLFIRLFVCLSVVAEIEDVSVTSDLDINLKIVALQAGNET